MIETVMQEFETMTCIRFVNRSNEQDYLSIESGKGCWSYVGRNGGRQVLSLSVPSCIHYGLIPHELMHSLGFFHEHTREDRDNYIEVNWENIAPANKAIFNFDDGNHQDLPYDYNSIMHYDRYSFSKVPGQPVMVPKTNRTLSMGESPGMDNLDVMKINRLYKCGKDLSFCYLLKGNPSPGTLFSPLINNSQ
ncbi:hypothetical protein GDO81_007108 [Engystomops pustulosus]|uniref:Metalloendopeptidase n=1 Tax=Engystomops pustulosus TaxID=76066 RepID=A0AAV7C4Y3_ENGPU|nr:hypothetical protein GDO81_007108 [Engystomops pustulosus]